MPEFLSRETEIVEGDKLVMRMAWRYAFSLGCSGGRKDIDSGDFKLTEIIQRARNAIKVYQIEQCHLKSPKQVLFVARI